MKKVSLANVKETTDFTRLPAGGYVCKYTFVEDRPEKEYLYMEFDIAKGEFAGYFKELNDSKGFWGGKCFRSYKEKALPMFKRMCSAVNSSNNGFVFDAETNTDEKTLIGKLVGLVLCEEEYIANDGSTRTRLYVDRECPVDDIIKGNFKVRPLKTLDGTQASAGSDDNNYLDVPKTDAPDLPW